MIVLATQRLEAMVGVSSRVSRISFQVYLLWISMPADVQGGNHSSTPKLYEHILVVQSTMPIERRILSQSLSWDLGCHLPWNRIRTTGSETVPATTA